MWKWNPGLCQLPGGQTLGCYESVPANKDLAYCYEKDEWLATDTGVSGETGEAEENNGIYRREWPNHGPSIDYIEAKCIAKCDVAENLSTGEQPVCNNPWTLYGKDPTSHTNVLASQLADPGERTCVPWYSKNHVEKSPSTTTVIPQGANPQWPIDGLGVSLSCSDFSACSTLFDEPVFLHLNHSVASLPGPNEAEADYLATSSVSSSSTLTLKSTHLKGVSQDSNWVDGRIEYTTANCGEATCPFYLGNLTFGNNADTWNIYSDELLDDVQITNIDVQLRRPVLGVWRTGTNEVYLGDQMLDIRVQYDIAIGFGNPITVTKYATNSGDVFGEIGVNGSIVLDGLAMSEGDLKAEATLDYDSIDGSPPIASFSLASRVALSSGQNGLLVSSIPNTSSDPDGDLDYLLWIIDGQQVAPGYEIPTGNHTVRLEVRDSRFALDAHEQSVSISY